MSLDVTLPAACARSIYRIISAAALRRFVVQLESFPKDISVAKSVEHAAQRHLAKSVAALKHFEAQRLNVHAKAIGTSIGPDVGTLLFVFEAPIRISRCGCFTVNARHFSFPFSLALPACSLQIPAQCGYRFANGCMSRSTIPQFGQVS